jgi:hypothetical protein
LLNLLQLRRVAEEAVILMVVSWRQNIRMAEGDFQIYHFCAVIERRVLLTQRIAQFAKLCYAGSHSEEVDLFALNILKLKKTCAINLLLTLAKL